MMQEQLIIEACTEALESLASLMSQNHEALKKLGEPSESEREAVKARREELQKAQEALKRARSFMEFALCEAQGFAMTGVGESFVRVGIGVAEIELTDLKPKTRQERRELKNVNRRIRFVRETLDKIWYSHHRFSGSDMMHLEQHARQRDLQARQLGGQVRQMDGQLRQSGSHMRQHANLFSQSRR